MADIWREIEWWVNAGVSLPTACGGSLHVLDYISRIDSAFEIVRLNDQATLIWFRTRLNDQNGRVWECEEYVHPVALYEYVMCNCQITSGGGADAEADREQEHGRYFFSPLFKNCPMETDTRTERVIDVYRGGVTGLANSKSADEHVHFRFFEKYLCASLSLYEVLWVPKDSSRESKGNTHYQLDIEYKTDVESIVTTHDREVVRVGGTMLSELNPVSTGIHVMEAAFHTGLVPNVRYSRLPERDVRHPLRVLVYRLTGETGEPNKNIRHEP